MKNIPNFRIGILATLALAILSIPIATSLATSKEKERDVIEDIRRTGQLRVGAWPKFETPFLRKVADNEYAGFDFDLLQFIAKQMGSKLKTSISLSFTDFPTIDDALYRGLGQDVDVAVGSLTISKDREAKGVKFTEPYLVTGMAMVSEQGNRSPITNESRVGAVTGTMSLSAADALKKKYDFHLTVGGSLGELMEMVDKGTLDFVVLDRALATPLVAKSDRKYKIAYDATGDLREYYTTALGYPTEYYGIGLKDEELRKLLNEIMASSEGQKFLKELTAKYNL